MQSPVNKGANAMNSEHALIARLRLCDSSAAAGMGRIPIFGANRRGLGAFLVPRGTLVWAKIQGGPARDRWILVDARGGSDFLAGNREPRVQQVLERWLTPGKVFSDVGADVGYFCLVASSLTGRSGRIFAFEAEPDVTFRLRNTIERNRLNDVTVVELAVWSHSGTVNFDRGLGSPDRLVGHVTAAEASSSTGCAAVPAISSDDFVRSTPPPDVIKCDVEGAELEVFRGAANLLASHRPKVICERWVEALRKEE
jgi:FkbM family methyltransferase